MASGKVLNVEERRMFSLDVTSLFTNIQTTDTIEFLCDYIKNTTLMTSLPRANLV